MKIFRPLILQLLVFLVWPSASQAKEWVWTDLEVIGNRHVSKAEIVKKFPVSLGTPYTENPELWQEWCGEVKRAFGFPYAACSAVRYVDFKAYFMIDVVEKGEEYRTKFRPQPKDDVPLASAEIESLLEKLYKRRDFLFSQGTPPAETWDKGYLEYDDPEMHALVVELVKKVPPYRENLISVLGNDRLDSKRLRAADLLNWALPGKDSVCRVHILLDDPSMVVRNYISRFMIHFIETVTEEKEQRRLVDSLSLQIERPSHGDRNKGLYNLLYMAQKFPSIRPYIRRKAQPWIKYIAETSILSNVKGPAEELVKLL